MRLITVALAVATVLASALVAQPAQPTQPPVYPQPTLPTPQPMQPMVPTVTQAGVIAQGPPPLTEQAVQQINQVVAFTYGLQQLMPQQQQWIRQEILLLWQPGGDYQDRVDVLNLPQVFNVIAAQPQMTEQLRMELRRAIDIAATENPGGPLYQAVTQFNGGRPPVAPPPQPMVPQQPMIPQQVMQPYPQQPYPMQPQPMQPYPPQPYPMQPQPMQPYPQQPQPMQPYPPQPQPMQPYPQQPTY